MSKTIFRFFKIIFKLYSLKGSMVLGGFLPFGFFAMQFTKDAMANMGNLTNANHWKLVNESGLGTWANDVYMVYLNLAHQLFGVPVNGVISLIFASFCVGSSFFLGIGLFAFVIYEIEFRRLKRKGQIDEEITDLLDNRFKFKKN